MANTGACAINNGPSLSHYVIVRRDLPIGLIVANTIHAADESTGAPQGMSALGLATADEAELEQLLLKLQALGITCSAIRESEGEYAGQLMAIGVEPVDDRTLVRRAVSQLPLVK